MTKEPLKTSFSIDRVLECIRGLAALWVFMFHIASTFEPSSSILYVIARYGYQGVAVFFVISGYCIYCAAEKTLGMGQHPNTFLTRRMLRVMPPFWASIILLLALPFILEMVSFFKSGVYVAPSPAWMKFNLVEWIEIVTLTRVFLSQDGDLQAAFSPINAVYWSLAIELQLYLVMYVTLFFKSTWKKILVSLFFIAIFASTFPAIKNSGMFFTYWPAFFFGIALRWIYQHGMTPWSVFGKNQRWASCVGASLLICSVVIVMFSSLRIESTLSKLAPNLNFIAAAGVTSVLLWLLGGIEHAALISDDCSNRRSAYLGILLLPLLWLGQSSYSLYLLHGQLHRLPDMFVRQIISPQSVIYPFLIIIMTAALCFFFSKLVEMPFQKISKNFSKRISQNLSVERQISARKI